MEQHNFGYSFPAIKGFQAGKSYFITMCPLGVIPKIFLFDEEELVAEVRAQRTLNRSRVPEIADYILEKRNSYVFSALTASVDGPVHFEPVSNVNGNDQIGTLHIPMTANFVINDGQHRRAAIETALKVQPDLADETIAVVLFRDSGLKRSQQMFADLNRYAVKPSRSLGLLYDHGDEGAEVTRNLVSGCVAFRDVVEMEKTALASRSRRLFTFSAIYGATKLLLIEFKEETLDERTNRAIRFWSAVERAFPEWKRVREGRLTSGEVRQDYIHSHGVVLSAIGRAGSALMTAHDKDWPSKIAPLKKLDWSRSNFKLWEGRAMRNGKLSKANDNIVLTSNVIKKVWGLQFTPEERRLENKVHKSD
ncbi:MAG: DNA sulfur modification protein DndB [Acidiferrobacterales bacterium]|nr:DNA sulfur modification protein DndB [Acidiferrobacterales bacterium]